MRLDEFVNQKVLAELSRPDTLRAAVDKLTSLGFKSVGSGYYGQVFEKNNIDYVLKIFSNRDKAYRDFINLISSSNNPHFPKIRGSLVKINDSYSAIRMEKLKPNHDSKLADLMDVYLNDGKNEDGEDLDSLPSDYDSYMEDLFKKQPKLQEALDDIKNHLIAGKGHGSDLHGDNIMWRNSTVVIIDPIFTPA